MPPEAKRIYVGEKPTADQQAQPLLTDEQAHQLAQNTATPKADAAAAAMVDMDDSEQHARVSAAEQQSPTSVCEETQSNN